MDKVKPDKGIEGELVCPEAGQIVATFSNASPMWSRTVRFSLGAVDGAELESSIATHAADSCIALRAKKAEESRV